MNNVGEPADLPRRWSSVLWWAGPTALALLGASIVSIALVPSTTDTAAVPNQISVAAQTGGAHDRPRGTTSRSPRPDDTESPGGQVGDRAVVTPSRAVESEYPDHESDDPTGTPSPTRTREPHDEDTLAPSVELTPPEPGDDAGDDR